MRGIVLAVMAVGCSRSADDFVPLKSQTIDYGTYWCPTGGSTDLAEPICNPVLYSAPKDVRGQQLREWIDKAPTYAVEPCLKRARPNGAGCVLTRSVICSTQDPREPNVCFLTWDSCLKNIAAHATDHPGRTCVAMFDGEQLGRK